MYATLAPHSLTRLRHLPESVSELKEPIRMGISTFRGRNVTFRHIPSLFFSRFPLYSPLMVLYYMT